MSRIKSTTTEAPTAYRYSPGDSHTYTWDGGGYATVYRHNVDGPLTLEPTGDHVFMGTCARTASAFMDHVDAWRVTRPAGEDGS